MIALAKRTNLLSASYTRKKFHSNSYVCYWAYVNVNCVSNFESFSCEYCLYIARIFVCRNIVEDLLRFFGEFYAAQIWWKLFQQLYFDMLNLFKCDLFWLGMLSCKFMGICEQLCRWVNLVFVKIFREN